MTFSNNILEQRNPQVTVQPEEELQLNKFLFLIDRAADAGFWVDSGARFLYVNAAACYMTGYSREELLSMTIHDLNPDSVEVWLEHWRTIKQQGFLTFESLHRTKEGWSFPVEIAVTYLEHYGREYGCIFVSDITKRKQVEVSLKDNEALETKFRTWAETTDAIIFIIQGTQLRYVNPAAEAITGYKREELLTHADLRPLNEIKESGRVRKRCKSGFPQYQEVQILTKNGEERWLDCSVGVLDEGKQALLVTAIDITKRKQSEIEIRATLEQEKELGEIRARFVSLVSHEFRNPLHIISFSTSLLKRHSHQWTEEKKLKYLDRIQTAVEQLSQFMDGFLLIGRAEAEKLIFEPRALDLDQFCRNLLAEIQLSDSSSQHAITFVSLGGLTVCLDKKLLRPILTNLLDNAIKYSPPGSNDYLTKPCTAEEFLGAIAARLEKQAVLQQWYTAQSQKVSEPPPANTATVAPQSIFPSNPQMKEVFHFIEANYRQPIALRDVAEAVGYSPAYLTDLVRRQPGQTVNRWIILRRMAEACSLLRESD